MVELNTCLENKCGGLYYVPAENIACSMAGALHGRRSVSYTHLDVYKRQDIDSGMDLVVRAFDFVMVIKQQWLSYFISKGIFNTNNCLLYTSRCV